ncbi:MAG: hypothetical protein ACJAW8_001607 [Oleispira sp.]|jgi:hypothetical protein
MKNTKWINKNSKKQSEWIYHYLIKNCSQNPIQLHKKTAGVFVSEGKLATAEERLKMESAWRSHLNRQKTNKRNISVSKKAYQLVSTIAKRNNQTVGEYIENLIYSHQRGPVSSQQTEPQQTEPQQTEPQQTEPQQTEPQKIEPQKIEPYQKRPNQRRNLD